MSEALSAATKQISEAYARSKDDVLLKAIAARLGDFKLESLHGRLRYVCLLNGEEEYTLDGRLLVTFKPIEFDFSNGRISISQQYLAELV